MDKFQIFQAISTFRMDAKPEGSDSQPATIGDIKRLVEQTAKLAEKLAKAMDH